MTEFFTLTIISLLMIISPGPDFAVVTKTSIGEGRKAGIGSAFGIAVANWVHVAINLLGLGLIIANSVLAFTVIKVLGAIYLIYIGFKGLSVKAIKNGALPSVDNNSDNLATSTITISAGTGSAGTASLQANSFLIGLRRGFLTCMLNPKAGLFFLSFFSVILSSETPISEQVGYGLWISFMALAWFTAVAFFFTHQAVSQKIQDFKIWIERIAGLALVILGLQLLFSQRS